MKLEIINAPVGANWLSDFLIELPENCLFNKRKTGCGGTELVIRNNQNSIIAMPYVNLVKNKEIQHKDTLLGVYEGVTKEDISDYIRSHEILKIATTYDSLPRVITALQSNGIDVFKDMFLLVDE